MGGKHQPDEATYWRNRRKAQRRLERLAGEPSTQGNGRDPFDNPLIRKNSADLRLMEQQPISQWPQRLFRDATIEELMQGELPLMAEQPPKIGIVHKVDLCAQCRQNPSKDTIHSTRRSQHGDGFNLYYFCSYTCQAMWKAKNP